MILRIFRSSPIVIFFTFLFVFGAPIKGVPLNTAKLALVVAVLVFGLMLASRWVRGDLALAPRPLYMVAGAAFLLMLYSVFWAIVNQTGDYALSYNLFILTVENILGSYIFYRVFLSCKSSSQMFDIFIWIGLIQSVIIVSMLANVSFRELAFEWFANEATIEMSERYGGVRGFGVAGSVTYDLSVLMSIFMMFSAYQLCHSSKPQMLYIIAWLFGFLAVMVSGRTGFLGVLLSLVVIFRFSNKGQAWLGMLKLVTVALISIMSLLVVLNTLFPEVSLLIYDFLIPYAFEIFLSAAEGDGFSTNSSDVLKSMYFPIPEQTFWLGDARWVGDEGGYYMHTDAGYMRHALFYGFIGSLFLYALYAGVFSYLYLVCTEYWRFVVMAFAGYAFIAHIKGDFLVGSSMNAKIIFLMLAYVMWYQRHRAGCIKRLIE